MVDGECVDDKMRGRIVGKGRGRLVYEWGDREIVKIPLSEYRIKTSQKSQKEILLQQNLVEWWVYRWCPEHLKEILCPLRGEVDDKGKVLVWMPKVRVIGQNEEIFHRTSHRRPKIKNLYKIMNYDGYREMIEKTEEMCSMFKLSMSDLINSPTNWGIMKDRIVYIDYGYREKKLEEWEIERGIKNESVVSLQGGPYSEKYS